MANIDILRYHVHQSTVFPILHTKPASKMPREAPTELGSDNATLYAACDAAATISVRHEVASCAAFPICTRKIKINTERGGYTKDSL